jgi:hypothetical protein
MSAPTLRGSAIPGELQAASASPLRAERAGGAILDSLRSVAIQPSCE